MKWWARYSSNESKGTNVSKDDVQKAERDARIAALNEDRQRMIPGIYAEQPKRLEDFKAALARDRGLYEFRCERWGDFLAVFVKRGEDPVPENVDYYTNRLCAAVNIGKVPRIELLPGRAPDLHGHAQFYARRFQKPDGTYEKEVVCRQPDAAPGADMLVEEQRPEADTLGCYDDGADSRFLAPLPFCARPAEDDRIKISGNGQPAQTLHVPFGLGAEVYQKMLQAIGGAS